MKCPTCGCTLPNRDPEANELHIASCAELAKRLEQFLRSGSPPPPPPDDDVQMTSQPGKSMMDRFSGLVTRLSRTAEEKMADNAATADELMRARWGDRGSATFELCMRYWAATRMTSHWYVACQTSLSGKKLIIHRDQEVLAHEASPYLQKLSGQGVHGTRSN
jgi:hypothetical protein